MIFTRRNLLRGLGLAGPAYFLASARSRKAKAVDPTIPTRIVFFYTPHGTLMRQWVNPPAGASTATETNFALGPILQPLSAYQDKLLLVQGLDMVSQYTDTIPASNAHVNGQTHALSAIGRVAEAAAGGISIDEFIAQGINSPTPVTSVPILEMSARYNEGIAAFLTSWSGPNQLDPPLTDPLSVYNRVFPNGPPSAQAQMAAMASAQKQKSILDATLAEYAAVTAPLSSADKTKLNAHASLIRALETQLQLAGNTVTCSAPDQTMISTAFSTACPDNAGDPCVQAAMTGFIPLAVAALACDVTRVITIDSDQIPPPAGIPDIHLFLHGMDDTGWYANEQWGTNLDVQTTAMDPGNITIAINFYAAYAQMFASLLQQLDAVPESDGSTLLDHTIVVWCSEIGSPGHVTSMMNYVLAGGSAVPFTTGRYLSMPRTPTPSSVNDPYPTIGIPHNNLFVSLANFMGLSNVTTFGDPTVCTGALTQLNG